MPQQLNQVSAWIYNTLASSPVITDFVGFNADAGIWNIYESIAPQDAGFPRIVFTFIGSTPKYGSESRKIFTKLSYQVIAIDEHPTSFGDVGAIADEIERLFHQDQLNNDSELVAGSTPEGDIQFPDLASGKRRNHQGKEVTIFAYGQSGN